MTPLTAALPDDSSNNDQNNSNNYQGQDFRKILDQYPNTTPMQEKLKNAIDVMKYGDLTKPDGYTSSTRDAANIPEFTTELLSVDEIMKNGKMVGKKITTKSTLVFENNLQTGQSSEEYNRIGFDNNLIEGIDDASFKEMCKQANGKITDNGTYCDVEETVKNDLNLQLAKLNNEWLSDDFYLLEGEGADLETAKEEAQERGIFPPKMQTSKPVELEPNNKDDLISPSNPTSFELEPINDDLISESNPNESAFEGKDNDFFESESNPNGLDVNAHQKKFEFVEEFTIDFTEASENIPDGVDVANVPITPTSYSFSDDEQQTLQSYLSGDFSELFLPKAEAQAPTETISEFAMMGFTIAPPKLSWQIQFSEAICFTIWYPTQLHITWGGFLGIEITHFHLHFAHKNICLELIFFKAFAGADIGAGFRLPIEVVLEDVPQVAFDGEPFTIKAFVKPKDFTVEEYIEFCENQDIKNDFFLRLSAAIGQDPCTRFAFENFFYADSSISGTGFERIDVGHIGDGFGNEIDIEGDEFVIKFKVGAGIVLKLINRTVDVCSILALASFSCIFGYNVDVGLMCTLRNIRNLPFDDRVELALSGYPQGMIEKLKELQIDCSSFATPVGVGSKLFIITFGVPADCNNVDETDFPPRVSAAPSKFGPFKKKASNTVMCEKPGPKCICTNGIIKQFGIKKGPVDITLGIGVGAALGFSIEGGPVTTNLQVSGDAIPQSTSLKFGDVVEADPGAVFDSGCVTESGINLGTCSNEELPSLKFGGVTTSSEQEITITPSDENANTDDITVELDDFNISLQSFSISANPTIELTGSLAALISKFTGVSIGFNIPIGVSFGVDAGSGINVGQHARTAPISITIPVDYFGVIIPSDIVKEAEGPQTFVDIGTEFVNPEEGVDVLVTNDAPADGLFDLGPTAVTWTAVKSASEGEEPLTCPTTEPDCLTRIFTQTITIVDTTPPEITIPEDIDMFEAVAPLTPVDIGLATAVDVGLVDPSPVIGNNAPTNLEFPLGETLVEWTATDASGNEAKGIQSITVVDTTPPIIMAPADVFAFIEGFQAKILFHFAQVVDLVDPNPGISTDQESAELIFTCADGTDLLADTIYLASGSTVSVGDKRLANAVNAGFTDGSVVASGDADVGNQLFNFASNEKHDGDDAIFDSGETVYLASGSTVSVGDTRLANAASVGFTDASIVASGDADVGNQLFNFALNEKHDGDDAIFDSGQTEKPQCDDGTEPERDMIADFSIGTTDVRWTAVDEFGNSAFDDQVVTATIFGDENLNFVQDILEVPGFPCSLDTVPCKFSFTDEFGNTASGEIVDRGGKDVVVLLPEDSSAITIAAGPREGTSPAQVSVCDGLGMINLEPNSQVSMLCASVTVIGIIGNTVVEFIVGDNIAVATIPSSTAIRYDDFFFNLEYVVGEEFFENQPVTVTYLGETIVLDENNASLNLDEVPPVLQVTNIIVGATTPDGGFVDYEISATDNLDPNPVIACDKQIGDFFPFVPQGPTDTTVNCTVTDTSVNSSEDSFTVTMVGTRQNKQVAIDELQLLKDELNDKGQEKMDEALEYLTESIFGEPGDDEQLWEDEFHLFPDSGDDVFGTQNDAVEKLMEIIEKPDEFGASDVVADIVDIIVNRILHSDMVLAQNAIDDAAGGDADLKEANEEMSKAAEETANGEYDKAIENYHKAWESVLKATGRI